MDVMLHKRCAKFIYVVPEGLRELMSDISREVIRSQPEHIYTFIADYLDALMITRENARVAARLVDNIIRIGSTTVELLERTGMTREEADRMATIIQCAFKQYMACRRGSPVPVTDADTEVEEEQDMISNVLEQYGDYVENEAAAAEIIQRAFRAFKERHDRESQMLSGMIDWRVAARSAIYLYRKTGVPHEEANRAATLIKAAYKGYYTRRVMKRLLEEGTLLYEEGEDRLQEEEVVEVEEEIQYEDVSAEIKPPVNWRDYLAAMVTDDGEGTSRLTDYDMTSTEVADSIMDSVLKLVPSEIGSGQPSGGDWTEGLIADQTFPGGLETETAEYLDTLQEMTDAQEDLTFESGTMTAIERSSQETEPLVEGEAASSPENIEEIHETEEIGENVEEIPPTSILEDTEYSETITETEVTTDAEATEEV